jgi:hypothetical protein
MLFFSDFSHMRNMSTTALHSILFNNPTLRYLYLERSYNAVNDITLHVMATRCPHIRTLSLSHCSKITDQGLALLSQGCHLIRDLNLAHCTDLTNYGLSTLIKNLVDLKVLSLECIKYTI